MTDRGKHISRGLLKYLAPVRSSLRLRILSLVFAVVLGSMIVLSAYALDRFEEATVLQLKHEGLMLSDLLEATIAPSMAGDPDIASLQAHLDRVGAARAKNDIEINILLLEGYRSTIVASNIPDNVEKSSVYEHRDMMAALEKNEPILFVGRDDDNSTEPPAPPSSPDFYIRPGERFVSITTPLAFDGRKLGSINTKLSLSGIDRQLNAIRAGIVWMAIALPLIALLLFLWAIQRGLRPVNRLAGEVAQIESSNLTYRFSSESMPLELRPIVARLNELMERIEAAFHREHRFTSNVAHELRTPIATLKVMAEVGLQEAQAKSNGPGPVAFLEDTLAVARQMDHLVANLLGLVRCEAGQQETNASSVDLGSLVESAWEAFKPRAAERGIACHFGLGENAVVQSDRTILEAIVQNLLANAVAHTERGGTVHCALTRNGGNYDFMIANPCGGLAQEDLDHVFEPFWRKEESHTDQTHCGLGLSLVSAYCDLIGVEHKAELADGDMFRFTLRIPLSL